MIIRTSRASCSASNEKPPLMDWGTSMECMKVEEGPSSIDCLHPIIQVKVEEEDASSWNYGSSEDWVTVVVGEELPDQNYQKSVKLVKTEEEEGASDRDTQKFLRRVNSEDEKGAFARAAGDGAITETKGLQRNPARCTDCEQSFEPSLPKMHMRIHVKENQFTCSTCKECFRDKPSLVRHKRSHTKERPYQCTV
ncbi:zinc finger protein 771-like [Ambystoma mexicanum]|uniref:zinc finger protein 771-like n=1 Tax=Ambystoma mexicanum TaxID=8296 RepID=UPI0037E742C8